MSITSSSDGSKLAAVVYGGSIYTSTNGGMSWTLTSAPSSLSWQCITSSSDGSKLAAVVLGGGIYISIDGGLNWNPDGQAPSNTVSPGMIQKGKNSCKPLSSFDCLFEYVSTFITLNQLAFHCHELVSPWKPFILELLSRSHAPPMNPLRPVIIPIIHLQSIMIMHPSLNPLPCF